MKATQVKIDWHPGLSIYASEQFLRCVGDSYGWIGGFDEEGNLRCVLPYTLIRKATVLMVRFRVETIAMVPDFAVDEERAFLTSAVECFRCMGADMIIPPTTNAVFRTYPQGAMAAPYGTHIVDLTQTEEALWGKVHSKHRNVIRNASKKGVRVLSGVEYAGAAFRVISDTLKRSSLSFMSHDAYTRMLTGLGADVRVFVAEHEGAVQGCAVIPFSRRSAYYVYGGTVEQPVTGATNLLQWEAMRFFRSLGVERYDFCGARIDPTEGSKQAGLTMYKERFGPDLIKGYLWKYTLNPLKSAVYSLAIRMLRGGDLVDAERHKLDRQVAA